MTICLLTYIVPVQPDEVFDTSYEALLSLSDSIGEAQSRATPAHVIASLPSASYREWANQDSESRCPICLDDVSTHCV